MSCNPFAEEGISLHKQFLTWEKLNSAPYQKDTVHPFTRAHIILMNAIETETVFFLHSFSRHSDNPDLRNDLALLRRAEQLQQKQINWLIPVQESPVEQAICYEAAEIGFASAVAQDEPDNYLLSALEFMMVEDIDHLYRFANLFQITDESPAGSLVRDLIEIFPGRPSVIAHRHPFDTVCRPLDFSKAHIKSRINCLAMSALEFQTVNFYSTIGNRIVDKEGRSLFQEIAQLEEQHLTITGSLKDPSFSFFETLLLLQYTECYLYHSVMSSENDEQIRKLWMKDFEMEMGHLKFTTDIIEKYYGRDLSAQYPSEIPEQAIFFPHKPYLRQTEVRQVRKSMDEDKFTFLKESKNMNRYHSFLKSVNDGFAPSQKITEQVIEQNRIDYRVESEGDHPVSLLRGRHRVPLQDELLENLRKQNPAR